MKKKILVVSAVVALLAILAVGGSLAWFSDTDEVTNVFTVGSIKIEQNEVDENGDPFEQEQVLMPVVTPDDPTDENYIAKIVDVTSTGENPAYVRTHLAIPTSLVGTLKLHLSDSTKWVPATVYESTTTVDGVEYTVYSFTYTEALTKGQTTDDLLLGVYIDPKTDLKDNPATPENDLEFCYYDDATGAYVFTGYVAWEADGTVAASELVNVLVATQGCQAEGFENGAQDALDTVFTSIPNFGEVTP